MWENSSEKSYLNILNSNQNIDNIRFLVFRTVRGYPMIFGYVNLTVPNLVHKESKCVGIYRLLLEVFERKGFDCFYFQQCATTV